MHIFIQMLLVMAVGAIGIAILELFTLLLLHYKETVKLKEFELRLLMTLTASILLSLAGIIASIMLVQQDHIAVRIGLILSPIYFFLAIRYFPPDKRELVSHKIEYQHDKIWLCQRPFKSRKKFDERSHSHYGYQDMIPERYELFMRFYSVKDLGTGEKAREFFDLLADQGEAFIPEKMMGKLQKVTPFDGGDRDNAVRIWQNRRKNPIFYSSDITMWKEKPFRLLIMVAWNRGAMALFNEIAIWIGAEYFTRNYGIEPLLSLGERLFYYTGALYGFITRYDSEDAAYVRSRLDGQLPGIFWANLLGPLYMDFFGEERIREAPCYSNKRLSHGGVLLQTTPYPTGRDHPADREAETILRDYLDHDAFPPAPEAAIVDPQSYRIKCATPVFDFSEVRGAYRKLD
jgi:hypothetical protein